MVSITKPKNMVQMPEIEAESNNEAEEEKNGVGSWKGVTDGSGGRGIGG